MAALIFANREVSNMPILDKDHFRGIGFCYGTFSSGDCVGRGYPEYN